MKNKRIIALLMLLLIVPALAQVNPGTTPLSGSKGGTNNAWMQFSGPTSSNIKTFFLPNTSDTIATLGTARTWTAAQSFTDADLILLGATSGSSVLHAPATSGGNVTFFTGNDTVVGRASTDTLTNKTINCANQVSCVVRIATDVSGYTAGSWTPTITTSGTVGTPTYTAQIGTYEQIGRQVTVRFNITLSGWTGSPTGNVSIAGLPVASANVANDYGVCHISAYTVSALAASNFGMGGFINPNTSTIALTQFGNAGHSVVTAAQAGTTLFIVGMATYHI